MPQGQFPVTVAGMAFTAALIQSIAPITAWKAADTPRSNTVTLANDSDLLIPMAANGNYIFAAFLFMTAATIGTGDLAVAFTWPTATGALCSWGSAGLNSASAVPNWNGARNTSGSLVALGCNGASLTWALLAGSCQNGGTAGNLQLQWSQNVSNATATTLKARSAMFALRTA